MFQKNKRFKINKIFILLMGFCLFLSTSMTVYAAPDYKALAEQRKNLPIESNSYENWPDGPAISAQ